MIRKPASDSIAGKIETSKVIGMEYPPPECLEALTEQEMSRWNAFIEAKDGWKEMELHELHALVKMKSDYEQLRNDDAPTSEKTTLYKTIQAQFRVLGLNSPHSVAVRNAGQGKSSARGKRPPPDLAQKKAKVSLLR